jgi:hypothetical protein
MGVRAPPLTGTIVDQAVAGARTPAGGPRPAALGRPGHAFDHQQEARMLKPLVVVLPVVAAFAGPARAADFDPAAAHARFIDAFNARQWAEVKALLADDSVFHRANAAQVYSGPDAIVGTFDQPLAGKYNVKFAHLDSSDQFTGNDGRVVERGKFAVTAGAGDDSCYAGSYMMTWAPSGDAWKLQLIAWQDLETELATCK